MEPQSNPEETLFNAGRVLADPAQREAFLSAACKGDAALRQRIEQLLADAGKAAEYFAQIAPRSVRFGMENTLTESDPSWTIRLLEQGAWTLFVSQGPASKGSHLLHHDERH